MRRALPGLLAAIVAPLIALAPPAGSAARAQAPAPAATAAIEADARAFVSALIRDLGAAGSDPRAIDAVLRNRVALDRVGRYLLGASRSQASPAELAEYERLVPGFILADVRGEIAKLVAQSIVIEGVQARSAGDALVRSRFRRKSGGTVRVDWRVQKGQDGALRMVDVYVNGVSRFVIRRDEFQAIVKAKGVSGLLAELRSGALAAR